MSRVCVSAPEPQAVSPEQLTFRQNVLSISISGVADVGAPMRLLPLLLTLTRSEAIFHGHVSSAGRRPAAREEHLLDDRGPAPVTTLSVSVVQPPDAWDWRNVDGINYATSDVNQHIPTYCGSCWVHGTVSALNDRIKVLRKARFPDVMISRQAVMNCVPATPVGDAPSGPPPGCGGGDPWMIHDYILEHPVPDETCQPYEAKNGVCDVGTGGFEPAIRGLRPIHVSRV